MSSKRVLPVVVLLSGLLAGAGWMAVTEVAHGEPNAAPASPVLTTTPAATTTTSATTTTTTSATTTKVAPTRKHTPTKRATPKPVSADTVVAAVRRIDPHATAGVLVFDRQRGKTLLSVNATRRFHSASLVKLLIAIDVLRSGPSSGVRTELARMIRVSDDDLASKYWVRQGGGVLVDREAAALGLHETAHPTPAGRWGNTWLSPRDMLTIYEYVLGHMASADRDLIVTAMANAPQFAKDGFDQWFGIPDGQRAQWAIKQGWSSSNTDICLHSTGLVGKGWRYVVVVLTEHRLGSGIHNGAKSATAGVQALAPLIN